MLKFHPVYENWMGFNLNLNICIKFLAPKLMKEKNKKHPFLGGNPRVDELLTKIVSRKIVRIVEGSTLS